MIGGLFLRLLVRQQLGRLDVDWAFADVQNCRHQIRGIEYIESFYTTYGIL
jgi:hypothetical protein